MDTGYKLSLAYFLEPAPPSTEGPSSADGSGGGADGREEAEGAGAGTGAGAGGEEEEGGVGGTLRLYRSEGGQMRGVGAVAPGLDRLAMWQSGLVSNERTPVTGGAQLAVLFWIHGGMNTVGVRHERLSNRVECAHDASQPLLTRASVRCCARRSGRATTGGLRASSSARNRTC